MANPELIGRSRTARIVKIARASEFGKLEPTFLIAVVRGREQVRGDRRVRDAWYPLFSPEEQQLVEGQKVVITRKTEKVGKGSLTTSTIRPA